MNAFSVAPFIQEHYPEYWGVQRYPKDQCAVFLKTAEEWGVFSNFYQVDPPLSVGDATFGCVEELYQLMITGKLFCQQSHQVADFLTGALPVFGGKYIEREVVDFQFYCRKDHALGGLQAFKVSGGTGKRPSGCPAAVSVHDKSEMHQISMISFSLFAWMSLILAI